MNIFLREMKAHRKSLIIWCIFVVFMVAAGMAKYVTYAKTGQSINALVEQMPRLVREWMGFGSFDLSSASGFFGMLFLYLVLMATIHAAMFGSNIIAKEERERTAEFLFVRPVSRSQVITAKLLAALTNIVIINLVMLLSSLVMVGKYSEGEPVVGKIATCMLGMFFLQLIFMFIGTGIAAVIKKPRAATSVATSILLVTYLLAMVSDLNDSLENLKYLTPFKYFDAKHLMAGTGFKPVYMILSVGIIAIGLGVTYVFYRKRDLHV